MRGADIAKNAVVAQPAGRRERVRHATLLLLHQASAERREAPV
jgi:hypothetical protein